MARSIYMPFGRISEHKPKHPERTGFRAGPAWDSDYEIREWPSEGALRTTLSMQAKREPHQTDWRAWNDKFARNGKEG